MFFVSLLVLSVTAAFQLSCLKSPDGLTLLRTLSDLPPSHLPATALENQTPFHLEIDVLESRITLLAPAPTNALNRLSHIAPSEFQANWKRSGGVVDGGINAHLWMVDLVPQWTTMESELPPVPLYLNTKYILEQGFVHLPAYFGGFSLQDLRSLKTPFWEVYSSMMPDPVDTDALKTRLNATTVEAGFGDFLNQVPHSDARLRKVMVEYNALHGYGSIKTEWAGQEGIEQFCTDYEIPLYIATVEERTVDTTGLTAVVQTSFTINQELDDDCEVTLHEFWPRNSFVDSAELKDYHAQRYQVTGAERPSLIFPHFSEMELPAHLAAPTMFMIRWREPSRTFTTGSLLIHGRYELPPSMDYASEISLPTPSVTVKCSGLVNAALVTTKVRPLSMPLMVVSREHLGLVSRLTTIFCGMSLLVGGGLLWKSS